MQHFDDQRLLRLVNLRSLLKLLTLGAEALLTPAIIRDFISILNILQQNPETSFSELIHGLVSAYCCT